MGKVGKGTVQWVLCKMCFLLMTFQLRLALFTYKSKAGLSPCQHSKAQSGI